MKICRDCRIEKPLDEFYNSVKKSGLIYHKPECKLCTMKIQNAWKDRDREHYLEIRKKNNRTPKGKADMRKNSKKWIASGGQLENQRNNKERSKIYNRQHRDHKMSVKEWESCKLYFNYRCAYCDLSYEEHYREYRQDLHKEHVDNEGINDLSNCVPSCKNCNSQKRTIKFEVWYNESNVNYTLERSDKIIKWLKIDHKKYLKIRKNT